MGWCKTADGVGKCGSCSAQTVLLSKMAQHVSYRSILIGCSRYLAMEAQGVAPGFQAMAYPRFARRSSSWQQRSVVQPSISEMWITGEISFILQCFTRLENLRSRSTGPDYWCARSPEMKIMCLRPMMQITCIIRPCRSMQWHSLDQRDRRNHHCPPSSPPAPLARKKPHWSLNHCKKRSVHGVAKRA